MQSVKIKDRYVVTHKITKHLLDILHLAYTCTRYSFLPFKEVDILFLPLYACFHHNGLEYPSVKYPYSHVSNSCNQCTKQNFI